MFLLEFPTSIEMIEEQSSWNKTVNKYKEITFRNLA